jgi:hypothetical protein
LESKKEHAYHFSTQSIEKAHDNRFGIKNSQIFHGIIHGNKMSTRPFPKNPTNILSLHHNHYHPKKLQIHGNSQKIPKKIALPYFFWDFFKKKIKKQHHSITIFFLENP